MALDNDILKPLNFKRKEDFEANQEDFNEKKEDLKVLNFRKKFLKGRFR